MRKVSRHKQIHYFWKLFEGKYIEQLLDDVFVISGIIKVEVLPAEVEG